MFKVFNHSSVLRFSQFTQRGTKFDPSLLIAWKFRERFECEEVCIIVSSKESPEMIQNSMDEDFP